MTALGSERRALDSSPGAVSADRAWLTGGLAAVAIAVALRAAWHTNWDVAWLLEAATRTLDGAIPYRDFLEVNPPASILIYVPAVFLGRLTGISSDATTDLLVFIGTAVSLALCGRILLRAGLTNRTRGAALLWIALVLLLILPLNSFAQREHIAVLAVLPCLAGFAARTAGERPRVSDAVLSGLGAGIALAIKPLFGLALLGPGLYLVRHRTWRVALTLPEVWIAGFSTALYGLSVLLFFPDYIGKVLPLVTAIYMPARLPALQLVLSPTVWIWVVLVYAFWRADRRREVLGTVLVLASAGFQAAFFIQGKGFTYHGYPAVALAALGCGHAVLHHAKATVPSVARLVPVAAAAVASCVVFAERYDMDRTAPGLTQAIAAVSPHPRLLTIGSDMILATAFSREIGADWVGSRPIAWVTLFAANITPRPEEDARFATAIKTERDLYAGDIERGRPDVILVDGDGWWRWTRHSPALVRALSDYRRVGRYGSVILLAEMNAPAETAPKPGLAFAEPAPPSAPATIGRAP